MTMKIRVKVTPNSRTAEVRQEEGILLVRVKEPPREGRANAAVIKAVAGYFEVPSTAVRIVSGHGGRKKVVEVDR